MNGPIGIGDGASLSIEALLAEHGREVAPLPENLRGFFYFDVHIWVPSFWTWRMLQI
jgi:hypothetical protein